MPWRVSLIWALLFVLLRCSCCASPRPLLWRVVVVCRWSGCCIALLCCLWSGCRRSLCRVSWRLFFCGASCAVLCWYAYVVAFCAVPSGFFGTGWYRALLPVFFWVFAVGSGCPLLSPGGSWSGVATLLSPSGCVARCHVVRCGVSWCPAPLWCFLFALLSCGGVLLCSAVCLCCCLRLLYFLPPLKTTAKSVKMFFLYFFFFGNNNHAQPTHPHAARPCINFATDMLPAVGNDLQFWSAMVSRC